MVTKEINLNNALRTASNKIGTQSKLGLLDLISFLGGSSLGGLPEGIAGVVLEKVARSPAVDLVAAKAARLAGNAGLTISTIGRGIRAPVISAITKGQK